MSFLSNFALFIMPSENYMLIPGNDKVNATTKKDILGILRIRGNVELFSFYHEQSVIVNMEFFVSCFIFV